MVDEAQRQPRVAFLSGAVSRCGTDRSFRDRALAQIRARLSRGRSHWGQAPMQLQTTERSCRCTSIVAARFTKRKVMNKHRW